MLKFDYKENNNFALLEINDLTDILIVANENIINSYAAATARIAQHADGMCLLCTSYGNIANKSKTCVNRLRAANYKIISNTKKKFKNLNIADNVIINIPKVD